jgi:hypothetical protein
MQEYTKSVTLATIYAVVVFASTVNTIMIMGQPSKAETCAKCALFFSPGHVKNQQELPTKSANLIAPGIVKVTQSPSLTNASTIAPGKVK